MPYTTSLREDAVNAQFNAAIARRRDWFRRSGIDWLQEMRDRASQHQKAVSFLSDFVQKDAPRALEALQSTPVEVILPTTRGRLVRSIQLS